MLGITTESKGRAYGGLDQVREIFKIEGTPVLCPVLDRNRSLKSGFTVESRTLRQDAWTDQLGGCLRVFALKKSHHKIDSREVGLLILQHVQAWLWDEVLLLAYETEDLSKPIAAE